MAESTASDLTTPECRICFPNLFEPKPATVGAEPKYSCILNFAPDVSQDTFKALAARVGRAKWPNFDTLLAADGIKVPFKKCAGKDWTGFADANPDGWYISVGSSSQPGVVDRHVNDIDTSKVFAGLIVKAHINAYAWSHPTGGKGVSFGLQHIQILRDDGTRYDGRKEASAVFSAVENEAVEEADVVGAGW